MIKADQESFGTIEAFIKPGSIIPLLCLENLSYFDLPRSSKKISDNLSSLKFDFIVVPQVEGDNKSAECTLYIDDMVSLGYDKPEHPCLILKIWYNSSMRPNFTFKTENNSLS